MRIRRGDLTDLYIEGERGVVMVGENVLGLSEIATRIVFAVPEVAAVRIEDVTAAVVATFGEPEPPRSAAELTLRQVHELAAHDVLVVDDDSGSRGLLQSAPVPRDPASNAVEQATAVDALRGALRHLLSDDQDGWSPPSDVAADALMTAARQHHMIPFISLGADRLLLPPRTKTELWVTATRTRAGANMLAADLARALETLSAVGVRALVFKGVALAAQAYGDFALRGAGDLDLLVSPADLATAHEALSRAGWRPSPDYPSPGPHWAWRHLARTDNELPLTSSRTVIDLHWHLAPTRATFPEFEALWRRRELVKVGTWMVPTLSRYDALAHSSGHAAKDNWRWLRSLLDVHQLASRRETWLGADRPLRNDQLISLGLAARIFGTSAGVPPVVDEAVELTDRVWSSVLAEQAAASPAHRLLKIPGHNFVRNIRTTSRTGGTPREFVRLLGRSALPPRPTAMEQSPHAVIAMPRVLARRAGELFVKASTARR